MSDEMVMEPTHPSVIPREQFLKPLSISEYQLAQATGGAADPDQYDHQRQAAKQGGYRAAAVPLSRHVRGILGALPLVLPSSGSEWRYCW